MEPQHKLQRAETIIVPGINRIDSAVSNELIHALRRAIARGTRVASICTGCLCARSYWGAERAQSDDPLAGRR